MLMTLVQQYPFVDAWLTVKVLLLVVYIALGIYAFRSRRSRAVRFAAWLAALAVFGFIVSVARAHDPLGRSEEHTSELQSLMRISYAVFCLNKKNKPITKTLKINNINTTITFTIIQISKTLI